MSPTQQRKTADALIAAFNAMDVPAIISLRSPQCVRQLLPASLKISNQSNDTYAQHLHSLVKIFQNFELTCHEFVEDVEARKMVMWLKARADTVTGEYVNEYMWTLEFDESGEQIVLQKEFVDSNMVRDFWPKLKESINQAGG